MHRSRPAVIAARSAVATLGAAALFLAPAAAHAEESPTPTSATTTATPGASTATSPTTTSSGPATTTSTTTPPSDPTSSPTRSTSSPSSAAGDKVRKVAPATSTSAPGSWTFSGSSPRGGAKATAKAKAEQAGPSDALSLSNHAWFLQNQLAKGGHHLSTTFDGTAYADAGLTADAVLALDAAGAGQSEAKKATSWLQDNVDSYMGGGKAEAYAGATAKLLNVAAAQGVDPEHFGGVDLVATLLGLEEDNGQFKDRSAYGDYSNTITQSLAITGLVGAGYEPTDDHAVDFLLDQQCDDGGFRITFTGTCTSDNDATSYAVQALFAAELVAADKGADASPDATAASADDISDALDRAAGYLEDQVRSDGGVEGGSGAPTANANSTGLVAQALTVAGADPSTSLAWLEAHAYDCDFPSAYRGGFAYDAAALTAAAKAGAAATPTDQDVRASAQALLGVAGMPLVLISSEGADASAEALSCATPTSSTSTTTSPSTSTTSRSATAVAVVSTASPTGTLAYTGAQVWPLGLAALVLLLLGAAAVVLSRRGGAHA